MRQFRVWLCLGAVIGAGAAAVATRLQSGRCLELGSTVTRPGAYCLGHDLSATGGISIEADDVTVDLGGHCLLGPGTPDNVAVGFHIEARQQNITVRNGCVAGFMYGLKSEPGSDWIVVEDVAIRHSTFRAALLESDDASVRRSIVDGVGGTNVVANASTMGLDLQGARNMVSETRVSEVYPVGSGDSVGISMRGEGGRILDNTVSNSEHSRWGRTYGVAGTAGAIAQGNLCTGQTYGFSGIAADGNSSVENDCATTASMSCPDNIAAALAALGKHDADDARRLFRVGRAYHKLRDYPKAAIYYLAAAREGIAEGRRIVERHAKVGYISADDKAVAERESAVLAVR